MSPFHIVKTTPEQAMEPLRGANVLLIGTVSISLSEAEQIAQTLKAQGVAPRLLNVWDVTWRAREIQRAMADLCPMSRMALHHNYSAGEAFTLISGEDGPAVLAIWDGWNMGVQDIIGQALDAGIPVVIIKDLQFVGFAAAGVRP